MRKKFMVLIVLTLGLSILVACGSKDKINDGGGVVKQVNIGSLKGPTTIGLARMIDSSEKNDEFFQPYPNTSYNFQQFSMAEEIVAGILKEEIDLATIPANLGSNLYNKTEGGIQVLAINTLGVLYMVENGENINSLEDLNGHTIYSVGKGTTPEGVLKGFIEGNKLENIHIDYRSEASEIAGILKVEDGAIALIPEPFVSLVKKNNTKIRTIFNMDEEWKKMNQGRSMVTGVLVGRKDFIEENKDLVGDFLTSYEKSIGFSQNNFKETAKIVESLGIIPQGLGEAAIPNCNIVFINGPNMVELLGNYLTDLFNFNPNLIGGSIPKEDFYYR